MLSAGDESEPGCGSAICTFYPPMSLLCLDRSLTLAGQEALTVHPFSTTPLCSCSARRNQCPSAPRPWRVPPGLPAWMAKKPGLAPGRNTGQSFESSAASRLAVEERGEQSGCEGRLRISVLPSTGVMARIPIASKRPMMRIVIGGRWRLSEGHGSACLVCMAGHCYLCGELLLVYCAAGRSSGVSCK